MATKDRTAHPQLDQLCFSLYAGSRELIKRSRVRQDALGLTYTQYLVMTVIWQENVVSVRDLGRRLYLDSGTLTPVLKTLEKNGLIFRRRCQEDERMLMVSLTPEGEALGEKAKALPGGKVRVGLTERETNTLLQLIDKMLAAGDKA